MQGIFHLDTAADLFRKLEYEFARLTEEPTNAYVAWNFFVTAEHLLDWLYPKKAGKTQREQARAGESLLQVCSHLANGAKHFEVEAKHHQSVSATERKGGFDILSITTLTPPFAPSGLFVTLTGGAKAVLGDRIEARELAKRVLEFWRSQPDLKAQL